MERDDSTTRLPVVARTMRLADDHRRAGDEASARLLDVDPGAGDALAVPATSGPRRPLARRVARRATREAVLALTQRPRIWKYRALSTCHRVVGRPIVLQPVLFVGPGEVVLGDGVQFGWKASPSFYTGYCYVEVSRPHARIEIGARTEFNNDLMLKSEGPGIRIGCDGLFGARVEIFDSDFHDVDPARRHAGTQRMAPVEIGDNVFVGMGVRILKGVTIGSGSVIGAGAVVTSSIPAGVVAAGNPARVVREI